jgi:DNA-binding transcriptional regulator YhcF (GntR family)
MRRGASLVDRLRNQIVGEMHIGHIEPGDRLPTYREISQAWEVDHRAVANAYRALEAEGLVEIRERRGVFLRQQEKIGGEMPTETAEWMADEVLQEAWRRRIKIPELPEFIRRCTAGVKLHCACIESTEDHRLLLCRELSEWFGFDSHPWQADRLPSHTISEHVQVVDVDALPPELHRIDLLVSTAYHATQLRAIAEVLAKPYVMVRMHPAAVEAVERHLGEHDLTVVCLDPRFSERVQVFAGDRFAGRIRVVLADDAEALARIGPDEPVLVSGAVADRLERDFNFLVNPRIPAFDPPSARELARVLIRLNLEAAEARRQERGA